MGTQLDWAGLVLAYADPPLPVTLNNEQNITRWMAAEQPPTNWWNGWTLNPLDVEDFVSDGFSFASLNAAAMATAQVLSQSNMRGIYDALAANAPIDAFSAAVVDSPWAASHYAGLGDPYYFASVPIPWALQAPSSFSLPPQPTISTGPPPAAPTPPPSPIMKPLAGKFGNLNAPIVALVPTKSGQGYTEVGADGGTFNYGDAQFLGSLASVHLHAPIVDAKRTSTGKGMVLAGTDGGIFCLGDAPFEGSEGGQHLNAPVVSLGLTPNNKGYWLCGADGGVFSFGDAAFHGTPA